MSKKIRIIDYNIKQVNWFGVKTNEISQSNDLTTSENLETSKVVTDEILVTEIQAHTTQDHSIESNLTNANINGDDNKQSTNNSKPKVDDSPWNDVQEAVDKLQVI